MKSSPRELGGRTGLRPPSVSDDSVPSSEDSEVEWSSAKTPSSIHAAKYRTTFGWLRRDSTVTSLRTGSKADFERALIFLMAYGWPSTQVLESVKPIYGKSETCRTGLQSKMALLLPDISCDSIQPRIREDWLQEVRTHFISCLKDLSEATTTEAAILYELLCISCLR